MCLSFELSDDTELETIMLYTHFESTLINHCHLTQSISATKNATWISLTHGDNHASIIYRHVAKWSRKWWKCVLWSDESMLQLFFLFLFLFVCLFFSKKQTSNYSCQRRKGSSRLLSGTGAKASSANVMYVVNLCPQHGWLADVWRYHLGWWGKL